MDNSFLFSMPDEMILEIAEFADTDDLPALALTCPRAWQIVAPLYLQRLEVLKPRGHWHAIQLVGELPPDAISTLCSMTHVESCSLDIDLQYVIEHGRQLRCFLSSISRILDVRIFIYDEHSLFESKSEELAYVIGTFLAAFTDRQCIELSICQGINYPTRPEYEPVFPRITAAQWRKFAGISDLASTVERVDFLMDMFQSPDTANVALAFAHSPSITHLGLHSSNRFAPWLFSDVLPHFRLPALKVVSIFGPLMMSDLANFLDHHTTLKRVQLCCASLTPPHDEPEIEGHVVTSVKAVGLSTHYVPAFFRSFRLPHLRDLSLTMPFCTVTGLQSLNHALNMISILDVSAPRLTVRFTFGLDWLFGTMDMPYEGSLPHERLSGISELCVDLSDALETDAGMVSVNESIYVQI
jgi:hypothetical protein